MLHVLSEDASGDGQIGWLNKKGTLAWQGFFRHMADDDSVELAFDCFGGGVMKSATLYKVDDGVFEGTDYDNRFVCITKMRTLQYCTRRRAWRPVPDEGFTVV